MATRSSLPAWTSSSVGRACPPTNCRWSLRFGLFCGNAWLIHSANFQPDSRLWWYDASRGSIVWKTVVSTVTEFSYRTSKEAAREIRAKIGDFDETGTYFRQASEPGVGLAWRVRAAKSVALPRPVSLNAFPRQGWLRTSTQAGRDWLATSGSPALHSVQVLRTSNPAAAAPRRAAALRLWSVAGGVQRSLSKWATLASAMWSGTSASG